MNGPVIALIKYQGPDINDIVGVVLHDQRHYYVHEWAGLYYITAGNQRLIQLEPFVDSTVLGFRVANTSSQDDIYTKAQHYHFTL